MLGLAIRNLFARKFRAISTASSVFFGVSMISGTLFISESVNRSFDNLFGEVNAGIDVTVREATVVDDPFDQGPQAGFEDSLLETVQEVEGVETAEGVIADVRISILGDDGDRIGPPSGGPPHIALSTVETDEFDALTLVDGESPDAPDEVAIDADSAEDEDFEIGDTVTITGDAGASEYTIVGLTQFGSGETSLGASLAQFTLEEAQRLTGKEGRFDEIDIAAAAGHDSGGARAAGAGGRRPQVRRDDRHGDRRGGRGRHHRGLLVPHHRRFSSSPASPSSSAAS